MLGVPQVQVPHLVPQSLHLVALAGEQGSVGKLGQLVHLLAELGLRPLPHGPQGVKVDAAVLLDGLFDFIQPRRVGLLRSVQFLHLFVHFRPVVHQRLASATLRKLGELLRIGVHDGLVVRQAAHLGQHIPPFLPIHAPAEPVDIGQRPEQGLLGELLLQTRLESVLLDRHVIPVVFAGVSGHGLLTAPPLLSPVFVELPPQGNQLAVHGKRRFHLAHGGVVPHLALFVVGLDVGIALDRPVIAHHLVEQEPGQRTVDGAFARAVGPVDVGVPPVEVERPGRTALEVLHRQANQSNLSHTLAFLSVR